jgi:glycosyltransferase involved in cell wall biosynthesis
LLLSKNIIYLEMSNLTIAIPTYNGAKRIPEVLEKLKSQTDIDQITWEVIVIDNNKRYTPGTTQKLTSYEG